MKFLTGLLFLALGATSFAAPQPSKVENRDLASIAFPYIYFERDKVLLDDIDFDATLKVAADELEQGGADSILTIWTIRDQIISAEIASRINSLYLKYIDGPGLQGLGHNFAVWHFAWAIGNIYRLGDETVKAAIQAAYDDALTRPDTLSFPFSSILTEHLTAGRIYMGDAHAGGRYYAHTHIVIPNNPEYLSSYEAYLSK